MPHIVLLGTLDSKLKEILYLREQILSPLYQGLGEFKVTLIDCGRSPVPDQAVTICQSELVSRYGDLDDPLKLSNMPRGEVVKFMATCATACVRDLVKNGGVHGIISAGGTGGTSLTSAVMREAAPIGMPKMICSTVASGDTGPIVGETDITMMYSVVDIAGSNALLRNVLGNAAGAMVGMAAAYEKFLEAENQQKLFGTEEGSMPTPPKKRVAVTMFGVTTPCVDKVREYLEREYPVEVIVFHATGHGGRAMERLVEEGRIDAVLDITTTELCDLMMGGNMSAGPTRLEAALKAGLPNVLSLGATDMVNFGPKGTVPEKYKERNLFEHNPTVTLMRTTEEECEKLGALIADKVKKYAKEPKKVQIRIPKGGVSMISTPEGPFADDLADMALFEALKRGLEGTGVFVVEDDRDINSDGFAVAIAEQLVQVMAVRTRQKKAKPPDDLPLFG
ncbi:hypothetical protein M8818_003623 [Zalaria obscura]|uniref:Uncharacterized protein n=1 Tax=Zalaria obscura TaxID=2024903 RepID=A0ACC3SE87_9PEZI